MSNSVADIFRSTRVWYEDTQHEKRFTVA